ncbi:NAD(P)-dependent oxidoreductase [Bacteriovorax sp. DB6_IX]|uniref:NAD-dependent epimerase/dehydratase family protein n=1 Tax=Bacteriovorax sp. DB6_IX TaxID=1353530 RepID=UPI00038A4AB5|nr:NAD-dependent epimerase/dehydratase family protein [Bacteriovorax sp. DB6_IX]EQC49628.1 NAD dependent epimerase/dehydratase family protein [Bacteriovorax sp. DB6_IX]
MEEVSIFGGTGFVGGYYLEKYKKSSILIERESRIPLSGDVLYLISTTHNYHVFEDVHKDIDTNLTILVDVLKNLEPGKSCFNFVSSWFVYGETDLPAHEQSVCNPKGFYSITKRAAEQLVVSYCETFKIDYRILRLCNVYGSGDIGVSKKKNALQFLINKIKNCEEIDLYHNGQFFRDYMHVKDVVDAVNLVITKGEKNKVFNIGSGTKVLFKDLIDIIFEETESTSRINVIDPPDFHKTVQVKDFFMSVDELKSLGFSQKIKLEEGIKELCR